MMKESNCCGNCEHYCPNSNINPNLGICQEFEGLVDYYNLACGWYCKKRSDNNVYI